jgi:hypothetical protein
MPVQSFFWPGSGSNPIGKTSLGIFDDDDCFVDDAPKVAKWVAGRLGYPIMDVEMTDVMIYDCFEEAITEYSAQVNEFNIRENLFALQGMSTGSSFTQRQIKGSPLSIIIELSTAYGTEAGSGGDTDWKTGYIDTTSGVQEYDLQALWGTVSESSSRIEIRRIFHNRTPAISRGGFGFGDAGVGPTDGSNNLLGEFGWAGYDGGMGSTAGGGTIGAFLVMPIYETLLRTQAIEFNDIIRRSQYTFEIHNNKVKFMPVPSGERIFFQYTVKEERLANGVQVGTYDVVSDYSNAPYTNMQYRFINDVGKRWIRKMTLVLAKETLGRVLSKYESIPSPDAEVRLDGATLRQEATQEKEILWDQLRETLEEAGRAKQMEKAAQNEENAQGVLKKAPNMIYIG